MSSHDKNKNKASKEKRAIQKLQRILAEKDEIINAIQHGEVDALVSTNHQGEENIFALKGSELTYQLMIDTINEGAITLIEDGTIIYCNTKFSEWVKRAHEEIINTKIYNYVEKDQKKEFKDLLKKLNKNSIKKIFTLVSKDKTTKIVYLSCKSIQLGNVNAISIIVTDLSELHEVEKRYSVLVDNASCGVLIHGYDGIIVESNRQLEKILGRTKDQIVGKDLRSFVPAADVQYATAQLKKLVTKESVGPNEGHFQRPNGEIRDIIFSVTHSSFGGSHMLLGIVNDVTENNRFRAQALLKDKLAAVGTLAAGIVHEINNPIAWIVTNLMYLKKEFNKIKSNNILNDALVSKLEDAIDESIQGGNKINEITSNLKGFTHADTQDSPPFELSHVINTVMKMVNSQYKNIVTIQSEQESHFPHLIVNMNKLHQVILNLVINAAQSMDPKNKAKNRILIKSYLHHHQIHIDVIDTGSGIEPDVLPRIFEPFFTTKQIGVGTGLGLALCYDIVKNFGGNIVVHSTVGVGTTFSIHLPKKSCVQQETPSMGSVTKQLMRQKILIVENDPVILGQLREVLKDNHEITTLHRGRDAFYLLDKQSHHFDIIIANFMMPDISGEDLYHFAITQKTTPYMIFTVDHITKKILAEFKRNDQTAFLEKDFTSNRLLSIIESFQKNKLNQNKGKSI